MALMFSWSKGFSQTLTAAWFHLLPTLPGKGTLVARGIGRPREIRPASALPADPELKVWGRLHVRDTGQIKGWGGARSFPGAKGSFAHLVVPQTTLCASRCLGEGERVWNGASQAGFPTPSLQRKKKVRPLGGKKEKRKFQNVVAAKLYCMLTVPGTVLSA